jgi:hypothetical protein
VSDELIGEDRTVHGDVYQIDGESRNFGEHHSTQRVSHRKRGALKDEIASVLFDLDDETISLEAHNEVKVTRGAPREL